MALGGTPESFTAFQLDCPSIFDRLYVDEKLYGR
jgi:hypothetical protein